MIIVEMQHGLFVIKFNGQIVAKVKTPHEVLYAIQTIYMRNQGKLIDVQFKDNSFVQMLRLYGMLSEMNTKLQRKWWNSLTLG